MGNRNEWVGAVQQTAQLKISETFELPVAEQTVWELINDPARVVPCMPGASLGTVHEDGSIDGAIASSLGPVSVRFSGTVTPEYDDENHRGRLVARGSDSGGRTKASATTEFRLDALDERRTAVTVDAAFTVSGGLAPFAQTGGVHLVRTMLTDFSTNLAALASADEPDAAGRSAQDVAPQKIHGLRLGARTVWSMLRDLVHRLRRPRQHATRERIGDGHEGQ